MASNPTLTPVPNTEWNRSNAAVPQAIPPHPALTSGGWYHGERGEPAGPGRIPVTAETPKSPLVALVLSILFGPVGLCYVSVNAGLVATALTAVILLVAGAGFLPLLVIWPLAVLGSVRGAGHVHAGG